jgi:hypothetical protein
MQHSERKLSDKELKDKIVLLKELGLVQYVYIADWLPEIIFFNGIYIGVVSGSHITITPSAQDLLC